MGFMRNLLAVVLIGLIGMTELSAQEQLGLRTGYYSGVSGLIINPASGPGSAFNWEVNLVSAGVFAENNYGFAYNTNVPTILRQLPEAAVATDYNSEVEFPDNTIIADYYDNQKRKFAFAQADVMGPSFMVNLASGHSFGLFTRMRAAASTVDIPAEMNYYFFDRTPLGEEFNIAPFQVAAMSWSEIGVNYAYRIPLAEGYLDIGASVKFLQGYEAVYLDSRRNFGLTQLEGEDFDINSPEFEIAYTTSNAQGEYEGISRNGSGVGIDLGMMVTIEDYEDDYVWKFGASLLDLGRIRFRNNAARHLIRFDDVSEFDSDDYRDVDTFDEYMALLSEQMLDDPEASFAGNDFAIWLPGALSFQAEYQAMPGLFVGGVWVQRLPYQQPAIRRGNLFSIIPRYERRWFGFSLPLSVYNYQNFNFGAAMRIGFLTFGSENLGSWTGRSDFTGTDFYVGLKINPFKLNLGFGGGGGRGNSGKGVRCYEF